MALRPWILVPLLATPLCAQRPPALPVTAAEASDFTRTSTLDDVRGFLDAIRALPRGDRLHVSTFGQIADGRDLLLVRIARPDGEAPVGEPPLRVLVVANIHGGEVCGKEAVQILLREICNGEHDDVLAGCDLWFVPVYNVDGNEKVATTNRTNVNGPSGGLGERENAGGLDLNRDCVKARSPEFRALLGVLGQVDPHALFDLHTTDGSPHAYHLTYAPSLSTNADPELGRYLRARLLPELRQTLLERHGYRIFDYGNFTRGEPRGFATFDHRPRFLSNYYGLRNRLSLLSEAYAYEPFEVRVRATRAFVLEGLRALARDRGRVQAICAAADLRCRDGDRDLRFWWDTTLIEGDETDVLVGTWDAAPAEGGGRRLMRRSEFGPQKMLLQNAFVSRQSARLPYGGWALVDPAADVLEVLRAHGVELQQLGKAWEGRVERFVPRSGDKATRPFQGGRTIELRGDWRTQSRTLAAGTWFVPAHQRLARLAAQLLEPESEDGLATWEFFEAQTAFARGDQDEGNYPVLRVSTLDGLELR